MPEEDARIFQEAYQLYDKWRGVQIRTCEQWIQVTLDMQKLCLDHPGNRLAMRLAIGLMDTIDDLYHDGAVPAVPDYIGRVDL